ncbi:MAG TPA: tetratricopeptide repeat protein [Candidatus Cybelea sp.]|nr:tetratricopeptide repeat protein [Candidatus Cybelea sp.]
MSDDIIREIDEEVRRDQYLKLVKRYAPQLTAAAIVILLVAGGFLGWREYRQQQAVREGEQFAAALNLLRDGKAKDAAAAFGLLANDGSTGYGALAAFESAAAKWQSGDAKGAIADYDRMAADGGVEKRYRDLAGLLAVLHLMDTAPPDELDRRLAPLSAPDCTWRYSALELGALVRLKAGDLEAARKAFTQLSDDPAAPTGVRGRATEMLAALAAPK